MIPLRTRRHEEVQRCFDQIGTGERRLTGKPLMLLYRARGSLGHSVAMSNTDEAAADALAAGDDDGVSAVATDGSAARNDHEPRRAGIPAGAGPQPPWAWPPPLQRSTRRPREIFAYVLQKNMNRIETRRCIVR
jgi:hypothetical protein